MVCGRCQIRGHWGHSTSGGAVCDTEGPAPPARLYHFHEATPCSHRLPVGACARPVPGEEHTMHPPSQRRALCARVLPGLVVLPLLAGPRHEAGVNLGGVSLCATVEERD